MTSPNGKYRVEKHLDFGEVGMGSPAFGHISVQGVAFELADRLFAETFLFSPDSRFLALEELVSVNPFRTKVIAVELPAGKLFHVHLPAVGTARPKYWTEANFLKFERWGVGVPTEVLEWQPPAPPQE